MAAVRRCERFMMPPVSRSRGSDCSPTTSAAFYSEHVTWPWDERQASLAWVSLWPR